MSGDFSAPLAGYHVRFSSFVFSLAAHAALIAALFTVSFPTTSGVERPVYDEFIKPNQHKIIFYDFRPKVPDVNPVKRVGRIHEPRGAEISKQTIIASSLQPKSKQILLAVPAPKLEIMQDIPAPIVVARKETVPPPPAPAPELRKPKEFIPPEPSEQPPKLAIPTPILDGQVPVLSTPVSNAVPSTPRMTFSGIAAPPKEARDPAMPQPGNAKADITVASLHPAENADIPIPNGERAGKFSKAPTQGEAASGDPNERAAMSAPDLTIRTVKPEAAPKFTTEEILYTERVRGIPVSTLSVPLRPSSRMIPATVDAQFKGRSVYTIVIPMEHIPAYAGDWILWFADRGSRAGETPVVRAPVPLRKMETLDPTPASARTRERIQLFATLGKNGRLDRITFLTKTNPAIQRAVSQDVTSWEFRPATSDGLAVDVDIVLEIPFNLPASLASLPSQ
jgi:hypothetical protein